MTRVKVLHVTFDMAIAGTEQVIRQLVEYTDPNHYEASVMCIDGEIGDLGKELVKKGFNIDVLKRKNSGLDFSLAWALRGYVRIHQIDVLHCHQYTPYVYGVLASLGTGVPVIFTEHGRFYPDSYKWKRLVLNPVLSSVTAQITAISKATTEALIKYENFPRAKIEVVYNGINIDPEAMDLIDENNIRQLKEELGIAKGTSILGTISRLDTIKNQKMMIEAFGMVTVYHPNALLLIVGDGPERNVLEKLSRELELQRKVIFTGFKVNPQRYFKIIDVFLLSSLSEGTSMTLLEAMAFRKPTVVTNVGGNPEIVENNVTGLVTKTKDVSAFSGAIKKLLDNPRLAEELGEQGQKHFKEKFTAYKMVEQYQRKYQQALKHNNGHE